MVYFYIILSLLVAFVIYNEDKKLIKPITLAKYSIGAIICGWLVYFIASLLM